MNHIDNPRKRLIAKFFNSIIYGLYLLLRVLGKRTPLKGPLDKISFKKILVIRLDHIGDVLITTPVLKALRERYPDARIDVMAASWSVKVLAHHDDINNKVLYDAPWFREVRPDQKNQSSKLFDDISKLWRVLHELRRTSYDLVIDPRADFRHIFFFGYLTGAGHILSFDRSGGSFLLSVPIPFEPRIHEMEKNQRLLSALGIKNAERRCLTVVSKQEEDFADQLIIRNRLTGKDMVMIAPGARSPLKLWPLGRFVELTRWMKDQYPNAAFLFIGGVAEAGISAELDRVFANDPAGTVLNLIGKTSLLETCALLKRSRLIVTHDGPISHMASDLAVPVIVLFGPTEVERFKPLRDGVSVVSRQFDCSPCLLTVCHRTHSTTKPECMEAISIKEVRDEVLKFMPTVRLVLFFTAFLFLHLSLAAASGPRQADVAIDYARDQRPVHDLVLGNNIEWVDNGDSIWDDQAKDFSENRIKAIALTHPTSLRFPGGVQADTYHWSYAIGPENSRQPGRHYYKTEKVPSHFGTDEFLKLCKRLNARPIFTLNIVSGTPQEAAEWVVYVNKVTVENNYPKVLFWEVGNEPYLDNKFPRISSQQYAKLYKAYALAIRRADPGAPLAALFVGKDLEGQYLQKYGQGWDELLVKDDVNLIDYGSIHNAYYPGFIWNPFTSDDDVFKKAFSSIAMIKEDIDWLEGLTAGHAVKFDLSEYNSFFGINTRYDSYAASLGGCIYVANVLHELLTMPSVAGAQYWSMLDNWYFGLYFGGKIKRPNFYLFQLYSRLLGKMIIPAISSQDQDLKVLAVKDTQRSELLVIVINNDLHQPFQLHFTIRGFKPASQLNEEILSADSILANNETGQEDVSLKSQHVLSGDPIGIKEHSVALLTFKGQ